MIRPELKNLEIIGKHLTGLEIRNRHNENTCFMVERYTATNTLITKYININFKHIDKIYSDTWEYIPQKEINNKYLIALLHEIAHYKQFKKTTLRKWFTLDSFINEKRENVAMRYARKYYKRFIPERSI